MDVRIPEPHRISWTQIAELGEGAGYFAWVGCTNYLLLDWTRRETFSAVAVG